VNNCILNSYGAFAIRIGWTGDGPVRDITVNNIVSTISGAGVGFTLPPEPPAPREYMDPPRGRGLVPPPLSERLPFYAENMHFSNMTIFGSRIPFEISIGGNQRVSILQKKDPDRIVSCKMLIGYTIAELKYINIKDNSHAGEWDLDELGDWTADLMGSFKLDLEKPEKPLEERNIKEMEPIHYEQYDYVLIACRNELDYNDLVRKLGIEGGTVKVAKTRRIKGRAIWYDQMKAQIIAKEDVEPLDVDNNEDDEEEESEEYEDE